MLLAHGVSRGVGIPPDAPSRLQPATPLCEAASPSKGRDLKSLPRHPEKYVSCTRDFDFQARAAAL
jgi:hypothetical protein